MKPCNKKRYYRNTILVCGIDPGALWKREGNMMILVDEDEDVRVKHHPDKFTGLDPDEPLLRASGKK